VTIIDKIRSEVGASPTATADEVLTQAATFLSAAEREEFSSIQGVRSRAIYVAKKLEIHF